MGSFAASRHPPPRSRSRARLLERIAGSALEPQLCDLQLAWNTGRGELDVHLGTGHELFGLGERHDGVERELTDLGDVHASEPLLALEADDHTFRGLGHDRHSSYNGGVQQRDYFERLMEQIVGAIATIAGFARSGQLVQAERELDRAWSALLGLRRADASQMDDATLRVMLGSKSGAAARLFGAEAEIEDARGNSAAAEALRRREAALR